MGRVTYQFLDKEAIVEAYDKATYLGTKKIFNIAVGYLYQQNAMWRLTESTDKVFTDMNVFGADIFYDSPINDKGAAITLYGAYNYADYGKNYLKMIATPNPASVGSGTGFYGMGTGSVYYAQAGYLFGYSKNEAHLGRPQVYVASEVANLQALNKPMTLLEAGINYYIMGSFGPKLTLGYQNRAIYKDTPANDGTKIQTNRKGMIVLQAQVSF
jgi:hypothetical protein